MYNHYKLHLCFCQGIFKISLYALTADQKQQIMAINIDYYTNIQPYLAGYICSKRYRINLFFTYRLYKTNTNNKKMLLLYIY